MEAEPNIRLALLVGSQARASRPADPFSDIDLAVFVREPERLLEESEWIGRLGVAWTSHRETNALGSGEERRVLFSDGQDVDVAVFPTEALAALRTEPAAATVLARGFLVLANKDAVELTAEPAAAPPALPSVSEWSNLANDYWFHLIWAAKKLRRGELLPALEVTNGHLRVLLVRAARWHALLCGPRDLDVWHGSRFFESWADPRLVRGFAETVAAYEKRSIARALRAHGVTFGWISSEIGRELSSPAAVPDEASLSRYLEELLELPRDGESAGTSGPYPAAEPRGSTT
ncbi:MAG: aminoglycoside 6-adenylyltransferase [Thermoplasmata archaeon]|nr:aminoglycoside 6-adenylyltransferase [Thermoplasmata archaeon]